ncbi:MAG: hypothetical protein AB9879_09710 [Methanothrix sp.]
MTAGDINTDFYNVLIAASYTNIVTAFDETSIQQIGLFEGGGRVECVSSLDGRGGNDIQRPNMQIQVRDAATAAGKLAARSRALAIIALLHRGTVANCISVLWDGRAPDHWTDDNGRHIYAVEFKVIRIPGLVG